MSILKKAKNEFAFGKVGLLGFAASGKTRTATEIAIGLHSFINSKKPVAFLDTETGSDFVVNLFEKSGIELLVAKSRTFPDLLQFMDDAENECDIAIVDSVTHIWNEIQQSYLKKINSDRERRSLRKLMRLEFQHWNQIKPEWAKFTDRFLCSKMHTIICGRAGFEYDFQQQDEDSKKELVKTGVKMKAENEMSYEPSLLIEMERVEINPEFDKRANKRQVINRAFVRKDRADILDGKFFENPTFETFKPHFEFLNIGGVHHVSDVGKSSADLFDDQGKSDFDREKFECTKACEEIQGLLVSKYPGQSADHKKSKADSLQKHFNTRSWTAIENMRLDELLLGLDSMKVEFEAAE